MTTETTPANTQGPRPTYQMLKERYAQVAAQPGQRERVHTAFESRSTSYGRGATQRISKAPQAAYEEVSTAEIHGELKGIEIDLAELAEQYGKLNVNFANLIGSNRIYGLSEATLIAANKILGRKGKVREIKVRAAENRGRNLETLVDKMAEVLTEQHEKAIKAREYARSMQIENVAHMRKLDESLIERLRSSYTGTSDLTEAEHEVTRLDKELTDFDAVLGDYEAKVNAAKAAGDVEAVRTLSTEMTDVLNMKYQVLDGRLAAEGVVSDVRRDILSSAEGVQSAKGAIAASKVNYKAINGLIDAMNELEFKYQHALEDFMPVFKMQSKVAAMGSEALDMKDALLKVSQISQRLMDTNAKLVEKLTTDVFELVKTPLYDAEAAERVEKRLDDHLTHLNQLKREWAEAQASVSQIPATPHYAKHS